MKVTTNRRLILAACVLGAGCALPKEELIGGYWWKDDPQAPVCERVVWKQVSRDRIPGLCGKGSTAAPEGSSCALGCVVISPYSELEAMSLRVGSETLYVHERRHALDRKVHP